MAVSLKAVASDTSAREYIPYESHLTPHIIRLESEHLLFVMKLEGAAHESADESTRNTWHESFCQYLRSIASDNVAVWSHVVRRPYGKYPEGSFEEESFAQAFDTKYRALLSDKQTLVNELYVSILYRRPKAEQRFFRKLASRKDLERDLNEDIATVGDLMIQSLEAPPQAPQRARRWWSPPHPTRSRWHGRVPLSSASSPDCT